jgi:hypothetical protein
MERFCLKSSSWEVSREMDRVRRVGKRRAVFVWII